MRVKRPVVLFLGSYIVGIIIANISIPYFFKLVLGCFAIFLYIKMIWDGKINFKVLAIIIIFAVLGVLRFKVVEGTFDTYSSNACNLGKGNKNLIGKVERIGKSSNSNFYVLSNCYVENIPLGKCRCYFSDENVSSVKIGNSIRVSANIIEISDPANEGEFNQKYYYRADGITFMSFAKEIEVINSKYDILKQKIYEIKIRITAQIQKIFNYKDAGLFSAMVTGDKSTIDKEQKKKFADNGIAHILAISGLHLSILGLALFEFLRKKLSVNMSAGFVSGFILLYAIFIDAGPASMRAIIMLYIRFLSLAIGRTYDSRNTLYIICLIFLVINPYLLYHAGFQFSYVAIFALNYEVFIMKRKIPQVIILTLFLFPITIYHYFTYPLYSILLNLIVIPLMSFVLGFGLLGLFTSFIYLPLGKLFAFVVHMIFILYDKLCEWSTLLPSHLLVIGRATLYEILFFYISVFLLIYVLNSKVKEKDIIGHIKTLVCFIMLIISLILISVRERSDMRMTFISIGQGDGMLIETKDKILSIDGGSSSNTSNGQYILSPHIKSRAISCIDYAYITHADSDHTNGILYLLENDDEVKIKNVVLPITAVDDNKFSKIKSLASLNGTTVIYAKEGDVFNFGENFILKVLSPSKEFVGRKNDQNEMSLVFRVEYKNYSALFTGDIGNTTMYRLLNDEYASQLIDTDVLKVPHHGSKNSNLMEFYQKVSPTYSVISYGKNNNYGHPSSDTVNSLVDAKSKILKLAESGQVDIYFDREEIYVKKFNNSF